MLEMLEIKTSHMVTCGIKKLSSATVGPQIDLYTTPSALPCGIPCSGNTFPPGFGPILDKLRLLLENLPNQSPSKPVSGPDASRYASLVGFQPDDELIEMTGSRAGALNMHLEHVFGHAARSAGEMSTTF